MSATGKRTNMKWNTVRATKGYMYMKNSHSSFESEWLVVMVRFVMTTNVLFNVEQESDGMDGRTGEDAGRVLAPIPIQKLISRPVMQPMNAPWRARIKIEWGSDNCHLEPLRFSCNLQGTLLRWYLNKELDFYCAYLPMSPLGHPSENEHATQGSTSSTIKSNRNLNRKQGVIQL